MTIRTSGLVMALAAAGACASSGGGSGTRTTAEAVAAAGAGARATDLPPISVSETFRGTFSPVLQSTGGVGPANKIRVDGSVTVISSGAANSQTRVRLTVNVPLTNEQLPWAIAPGACGNGAIALTAVNKFGTIDIGPSGRGTLEMDLAVALTPGARYHVEIYRSGQGLADVMACANLRKVE